MPLRRLLETQALSARASLFLERMCMQQQSAEHAALKNDGPYPLAGYICSMLCLLQPCLFTGCVVSTVRKRH